MLLLYMRAYSYYVMLIICGALLTANGINSAGNWPLRMTPFDELPEPVRDLLHTQTMKWFHLLNASSPQTVKERGPEMPIHFLVHDCVAHGIPHFVDMWDIEWNICGKPELIQWCREDALLSLYKTTESVFELSEDMHLHMSASCYRVRLFSRYLVRFLFAFPHKLMFFFLMFIMAYMRRTGMAVEALEQLEELREQRRLKEEHDARRHSASPVVEPGHPAVNKNLMSRHGNFRNRRRS